MRSSSPFPPREGGRGVRCIAFLLCLFLLTACGSIQIEVERTPTPDQGGTATVAALQSANRALTTQIATLGATTVAPIGPGTDSQTLRQFLLNSSKNWGTVWADARVTDYLSTDTAGVPLEKRFQVWVQQEGGRFRMLWSNNPERVEGFAISDGSSIRLMDAESGQVQNRPLNRNGLPLDQVLATELSSPLGELLFPSQLAKAGGTFRTAGTARLAGRDALIVEYTASDGALSERLWLDRQTGVLLRRMSTNKGGGKQNQLDIVMTDIQFDVPIPAGLFNLQISSIPQFAQDYTGTALASQPEADITPSPEASPQEQLYFYLPAENQTFQLVRLPGKCLLEETDCPSVEVVPGQPSFEGQPQPLLWSPDGRKALAPVINQKGMVYLYQPDSGSWSLVLEAQQVDALSWSPDGKRFAYSALQGNSRDIYLSTPDGKQVRNLTSGRLPDSQANLAHLAWQGPARLLFAASGQDGMRVYTLDVETGQMTAVEDLKPKNGLPPLPSPDGRVWAWTERSGERSSLLLGAAGTSGRVTAGFTQSSIWPLAWSPDGNWLAFVVYGGLPGQETADLYVTGIDGNGVIQLYRNLRITAFTWVSDSQELVVEADDGTGYTHLFVVGLDGSSRLIQAPGLRLDASWTAPAWGPA